MKINTADSQMESCGNDSPAESDSPRSDLSPGPKIAAELSEGRRAAMPAPRGGEVLILWLFDRSLGLWRLCVVEHKSSVRGMCWGVGSTELMAYSIPRLAWILTN